MISGCSILIVLALSMTIGTVLLVIGYKLPRGTNACPKCGYDRHAHVPTARCPECGEVPGGYEGGLIRDRLSARIAGWMLLWGPIALIVGFTMFILIPEILRSFGP